jgi:uncharacterized membrane protein
MQLIYKIVFILLVSLIFFACGEKHEENKSTQEQTHTQQQNATPASQPTELSIQPFFNGGGNTPEWNMQIKAKVDGSFVIQITQPGEQERTFTAAKEPLYIDGKVNAASGEVKLSGASDSGEKIAVSLITGKCNDERGKEHGHSCKVVFEKETLKGCGDYVE